MTKDTRQATESPVIRDGLEVVGETPDAAMVDGHVWHVYILRCADDSLYTGITTDLSRRLSEHNKGRRGASYTRSRRPVSLAFARHSQDRGSALREEIAIKKLSRQAKEKLIEKALELLPAVP